jgi:pyruvate formate-lyase activating enzyme-like uncharacterized protein
MFWIWFNISYTRKPPITIHYRTKESTTITPTIALILNRALIPTMSNAVFILIHIITATNFFSVNSPELFIIENNYRVTYKSSYEIC